MAPQCNMDDNVWTATKTLNDLVPQETRARLKESWTLTGMSESALRTGFRMGPFVLDAGHSVMGSWDIALISHGHADHVFSLASLGLTKVSGLIYAPESALPGLIGMCKGLTAAAQGLADVECASSKVRFLPAVPLTTFMYTPSPSTSYVVSVWPLVHSIPTVGYGVSKVVQCLDKTIAHYAQLYPTFGPGPITKHVRACLQTGLWVDLPSPMDAEGNKALSEVTDVRGTDIVPQFCYVTDTAIEGITNNLAPIVTHPIIIVECTFYDEEDRHHAYVKRHVHWSDLKDIVKRHPENLWVLIHNSRRYARRTDLLPYVESYSNVLLWHRDLGLQTPS